MRNAKLMMITLCFLSSCGNEKSDGTTQIPDSSTTVITRADSNTFDYDAAADGMLVAPEITRKLGDSLGIKMYEISAKPGDSIPLHSHPDHIAYFIQGGKLAVYEGDARHEIDFKPGMGFVSGPGKDAVKNIGKTTVKFIVVDIYRPRDKTE